ncbi:hypothetical protein B0H15DRAFT_807288 [Mycena belliarum]|uniref:Uncharacterized protein n=1 Tax=Mycena belliarum TaxID=1033014 RepID=A0AAD6XHZ7_9AGAR|nr:hypothetical protein B0H15DRAFT_807288 [Mycena belliae]
MSRSQTTPLRLYVHDWGAPAILRPPAAPPSHQDWPGPQPLPLHALKFSPQGAFDLRRHLGIFVHDPAIWNTLGERFRAADLAFLASGASDDNMHDPGAGGFFPEFHTLRDSVPNDEAGYAARIQFNDDIRKVLWDLATKWDRSFGSTTMILHMSGTVAPGTPLAPEYLRASAYLPPAFLRRFPDAHGRIADIVQAFIEFVGIPTVDAFAQDAVIRPLREPACFLANAQRNNRASSGIPTQETLWQSEFITPEL